MEKEKKSKKKIGVIVLMVILIIILLLCLVQCQSCSGDTDPTENTTATGEPTTEGAGSSEPSTEITTPSEGVTEPSGEATEPSTTPSEPSTEVTEPSTDTTEPSTAPTEPSTDTTEPSTVPMEPSTETTEPSTDTTEPSGHIHSYTETKTAPGCETEGYTTYTCDCGDTFTGDNVPATGHEWGEWVTVKESSTSATGTAERSCAACGSKESKTLDKPVASHTHSYSGKVTKAATCSDEGVKTFTCSCGSSYAESIAKTAHSYNSTVTAPACTDKGYTTYKCSACGDSYKSDYVNAKGHSYSSEVTKAATCSAEGVKTFTCSCGSSYTESIAKGAHSYKSTVTAPTCLDWGYTTYKCSACGYSYSGNSTEPTGHSFSSNVTQMATCTSEGTETFTCFCGWTFTEKIAKTSHKYVDTVIKPTCTADGYTTHTCSSCGDSYTDSKKSAAGHSYTSKVTTEATCSKDGIKNYTCSDCAYSYTETIKQGHDWSYTCTEEVGHGSVRFTCACGWSCTSDDIEGNSEFMEEYPSGAAWWEVYVFNYHIKEVCSELLYKDRWTNEHRVQCTPEWVVDKPANTKWTCEECGKETISAPMDCNHNWEHVHTDEVGYWEFYLVCRCGWTCTVEDAENAGYTADYDSDFSAIISYWSSIHEKSFPVADRRYHSYDTPDVWIVIPASDKWVCSECGKETTTKP